MCSVSPPDHERSRPHRRRHLATRVGLLAAVVLVCLGVPCVPSAPAQPAVPNIVLITLDDLGYGDLGSYGGSFIATPRLDQLAAEGMRFSQFYVNAPTCSSSRVSLLTGRYPAEFGMRKALRTGSKRGLPADVETLADVLGEAGYATGHFGKWHVGNERAEFLPSARGFDRSAVRTGGGPGSYMNQTILVDGDHFEQPAGHLTDVTTDYALDFIAQNGAGPFFLQVWYHAPHNPPSPLPQWAALYPDTDEGRYAALVAHADDEIGRLLDALEDSDLADNTIVLFASDNGAWSSSIDPNGPLRGQKDTLYEGGIRVPAMVRWPGSVPAAALNLSVLSSLDLIPTLAAAAGADTAGLGLAGRNVLDAWLDDTVVEDDEILFWEDKPSYSFMIPASGELYTFAVRKDGWKLVHMGQAGAPFLFDLDADPSETMDRASQNPALASELTNEYRDWRLRIGRIEHAVGQLDGAATYRRGVMTFAGGAINLREDGRFDFAEADFSLQARVLLDSVGGANQMIAERPQSWQVWVDSSGLVHAEVRGEEPSEATQLQSSAAIAAGQEHEVTLTVYGWINSPSTVRLYVDGVLQAETNEIERTPIVEGAVRLGNSVDGTQGLRGKLLSLDFFRASLSPDEVRDRDRDGLVNLTDNCMHFANAAQVDVDGDGRGNACDGDFDQDSYVGTGDRQIMLACVGRPVGSPGGPASDPTCGESDMNTDGSVDDLDLARLVEVWDPRPSSRCGGVGAPALLLPALWLRRRSYFRCFGCAGVVSLAADASPRTSA